MVCIFVDEACARWNHNVAHSILHVSDWAYYGIIVINVVNIALYLIAYTCTRGIWKVRIMVFILSNRFTYSIMCGIIIKRFLFSMLWHKFHEDVIMKTRTILLL